MSATPDEIEEAETPVGETPTVATRRRFVQWLGAGTLAAIAGGIYSHVAQQTQRTLYFENLPPGWDGARIVHLTDFHHGPLVTASYLRSCVRLARMVPHDIAFLTGDFVSVSASFMGAVEEMLRGWNPPLGVWASLGNHDHYTDADAITRSLQAAGIHVLTDTSARVERGGDPLWLAGVDYTSTDLDGVARALHGVPSDSFRIMLAHTPDVAWCCGDHLVDLIVSGHTHGGQMCLPGGKAIFCPTNLGPDYAAGVFRWRDMTLFVNRGLGTVSVPFRAFCPPEIAKLTLKRGTAP